MRNSVVPKDSIAVLWNNRNYKTKNSISISNIQPSKDFSPVLRSTLHVLQILPRTQNIQETAIAQPGLIFVLYSSAE